MTGVAYVWANFILLSRKAKRDNVTLDTSYMSTHRMAAPVERSFLYTNSYFKKGLRCEY